MKGFKLLLVGLLVVAAVVYLVSEARLSGFRQDYAPMQPVKFSHKVHAGDNKVDCMYCHFAADKGRHAGIPPTNLCMNCHSKIKTDSIEIQKIKFL